MSKKKTIQLIAKDLDVNLGRTSSKPSASLKPKEQKPKNAKPK